MWITFSNASNKDENIKVLCFLKLNFFTYLKRHHRWYTYLYKHTFYENIFRSKTRF